MKLISMALSVMFYPTDTFTSIKKNRSKNLIYPALIIILLLLIVRIIYIYSFHYPVSNYNLKHVNIWVECSIYIGVIFSWALAVWNVSEILDGEIFFRESFLGVALGMMPMVVLYIPIAVISNILGQSEIGFIRIFYLLIISWIVFLEFRCVMALNNYSFMKTVVVCLISFLYVLVLWCVLLILIVFTKNLWQFVQGVLIELIVSLS